MRKFNIRDYISEIDRKAEAVKTAKLRRKLGCNRYSLKKIPNEELKKFFKGETHANVLYLDTDSIKVKED